PGGARLDGRARGRAPGRASRHPLPAQVLPLVRGPSRAGAKRGQAPGRVAAARRHARRRRRPLPSCALAAGVSRRLRRVARPPAAWGGYAWLAGFAQAGLSGRMGTSFPAILLRSPSPVAAETARLRAGFACRRSTSPTRDRGSMQKDVILTPE